MIYPEVQSIIETEGSIGSGMPQAGIGGEAASCEDPSTSTPKGAKFANKYANMDAAAFQ